MTIKRQQNGFTLVELLISILISSLLALAVATSFTQQIITFATQDLRSQAGEDGRNAFLVLSQLLRHAESNTITITNTASAVTVDFYLPFGVPIWPNTQPPVYNKNAVRIQWDSTGNDAFKIQINNKPTLAALGSNQLTTLVGSNAGSNTRITGLSISPQAAGGFLLSLTSNAGVSQTSAGETFEGLIIPRN